jgi:hypothetical protein
VTLADKDDLTAVVAAADEVAVPAAVIVHYC